MNLLPQVAQMYRDAVLVLRSAGIPVMVGGAYAYERYTGIARHSEDFDLFLHPADVKRALSALASEGWSTDLAFPHWLAKAYRDGGCVDLVFSSGNGIAEVDDAWFERAVASDVLGMPVRLIPVEEMIWSKAFIMERERFDGADVAHLLLARAADIDWQRLLIRFGDRWRVLLCHLLLFGFAYPGQRARIPRRVMRHLLDRAAAELVTVPSADRDLCRGTLLSREQYLPDLDAGYEDARLREQDVAISAGEIDIWNDGIAIDGEAAQREATQREVAAAVEAVRKAS